MTFPLRFLMKKTESLVCPAMQCREEMKIASKYLSWIDKDFDFERSSGPNIHDASKITITKQHDGTLLKTVTKQTYANKTVRNKRNHDGDKEISEEGYRKRAKMISNILDHASNQGSIKC